jgi:hypothetical protein
MCFNLLAAITGFPDGPMILAIPVDQYMFLVHLPASAETGSYYSGT